VRLAIWLEDAEVSQAERLAMTDRAYKAALSNPGLPHDDPIFLELQFTHGLVLCVAGHGREGLELLDVALRTTRAKHRSGLFTEVVLEKLSICYATVGDVKAALAASQERHRLSSEREAPGSWRRAVNADNVLLNALGARRADVAKEALIGLTGSLNNGWSESKLLWLMNLTGDTERAARYAPEAIERATPKHWRIQADVARVGWSYALRQDGRSKEAEQVLREVKETPNWFPLADVTAERAAVQLALHRPDEALALANRAIQNAAVTRLMTDPYLSDLHLTRGQALLQLGRAEEALASLRVSDEFWRSYDADSHWAAEASYWLARALIVTGDPATGRPMLKAARAGLAKSPMPLHRRLAAQAAPAR
jgi:tetratricopeptide (TPR) repeat protein